jgi:hypothetical protein
MNDQIAKIFALQKLGLSESQVRGVLAIQESKDDVKREAALRAPRLKRKSRPKPYGANTKLKLGLKEPHHPAGTNCALVWDVIRALLLNNKWLVRRAIIRIVNERTQIPMNDVSSKISRAIRREWLSVA